MAADRSPAPRAPSHSIHHDAPQGADKLTPGTRERPAPTGAGPRAPHFAGIAEKPADDHSSASLPLETSAAGSGRPSLGQPAAPTFAKAAA